MLFPTLLSKLFPVATYNNISKMLDILVLSSVEDTVYYFILLYNTITTHNSHLQPSNK